MTNATSITWVIQFGNPTLMKSTKYVCIIFGHHLSRAEHKASAAGSVLLEHPSIRTLVGVLGEAQPKYKTQQEQLHD